MSGLRRFAGTPEPAGPGRIRVRPSVMVVWAAVGVVALLSAISIYPRVYPAAPHAAWTIDRDTAIDLVLEQVRSLGDLPASPYVTATLQTDPVLELRLLQKHPEGVSLGPDALRGRIGVWRVTVFRRDAGVGDWSYLAELGLDGELITLLQGVETGFESPVLLEREDAIARADAFLLDFGFELDDYYDPVERRVEMATFSYQLLRYEKRDSESLGPLRYGVEVRFAGEDLKGFSAWEQDEQAAALASDLQGTTQLQFVHILLVFALMPIIALMFVRRYHEGIVGVRRGVEVFLLVLGSSLLVLVFTARGASEGMDFGNFTRPNVTLGWIGIMLLIYFPTLAVFAGMSCALGESLAQGTWRSRLATMDAVLRGRWSNSSVAGSSLRGVSMGFALLLFFLVAIMLLQRQGFEAPFSLVMGPWWPAAALPGPFLLLLAFAFTVTSLCFCLLTVYPLLAGRLGMLLGGLVTALILTTCFFAPFPSVPTLSGFPAYLTLGIVTVFLFVRYDFMTAFLAHLVSGVGVWALPLIAAGDAWLRFQGVGALMISAAPLWFSLRHLLSDTPYRYEYDDVPPHVRRIAERERQRVELETARGIQASILPELPEQLSGVEVAHTYLPATEVGGDFYDAMVLEDGRLSVAIGDVAGHGVSSGLIMSMARSALAVQVTFRPEVEDVIAALNRVVYQSARRRLLTTLCYAVLDPKRRNLSFASAGHLYPYRVTLDGEVETLESTAYPLGVREDLAVQCRSVDLDPGDAVFLSSDGLVEARRLGSQELFGFDRLADSLARHAGRDAEGIRQGVLADLADFVGVGSGAALEDVPREDDLTVLVLRLPH